VEGHVVGKAEELLPGQRLIVTVKGINIGVFNVKGKYYALNNRCPHQGGPLCEGPIGGLLTSSFPGQYEMTRADEIVRCPWHLWEFDILTGRAIGDPVKDRVKTWKVTVEPLERSVPTYPVTVEAGLLVVHV
jgi:nitrite reductase/ring-hydroxylating ferredoxin subunit